MSYHVAQLFGAHDARTIRTCRAASASLFQQAMPYLSPDARRLSIPWRNQMLSAYLQRPAGVTARAGLVVILNGASTSKEESFAWAAGFLRAGLAVLTMDTPGSGEATGIRVPEHDQDDVLDGVFDTFRHDPGIDLAQVSVVGVSLGGALGIRCAAHDRRIMCAAAVTPPYDPARWIHRASPIVIDQLNMLASDWQGDPWNVIAPWSLHDIIPSVRAPLLVFGAGRDLVVPPSEAQLLASRAGGLGTLVWYPAGGHCLYESIPTWTHEAATWISSVAAARAEELQAAGVADPVHVAEIARDQLIAAGTPGDDLFDDDSSARLIDDDDADYHQDGDYARLVPAAPRDDPQAPVEDAVVAEPEEPAVQPKPMIIESRPDDRSLHPD
jgi:alpha-beta hydrolase superfamily lysophospholipase